MIYVSDTNGFVNPVSGFSGLAIGAYFSRDVVNDCFYGVLVSGAAIGAYLSSDNDIDYLFKALVSGLS